MKVLINTISTKRQAGGAFQIAYNFVVNSLKHKEIDWIYVVSSDLDAILPVEVKKSNIYRVFPTQPDFKHTYKKVKKELAEFEQKLKPDVIYSITAPSYFSFKAPEVMRFTNPLVTHPNKYSNSVLSFKARMRMVLYCWNQRRLMRKAHFFITQTETTKRGIIRITGVNETRVKVVNNVLPTIFAEMNRTHIEGAPGWIDIACIAAPVPHKNLDIIPEVLRCLQSRGVDNVRFHVTIPKESPLLDAIKKKLVHYKMENRLINHGRCPQKELANIYRRCEFCFLPTLLEVFSVSTLEAMFFDLKIVATNFSFNKDVLGDACLYYEPMNAEEAAVKFVELIRNESLQKLLSEKMKQQLAMFDNYDKHFNSILAFLIDVAMGRI